MRKNFSERCIKEARYMIQHRCTVRGVAAATGVSKSTVHKDLTERLKLIDGELYASVQQVIRTNKAERHIRGGNATKVKYEKLRR